MSARRTSKFGLASHLQYELDDGDRGVPPKNRPDDGDRGVPPKNRLDDGDRGVPPKTGGDEPPIGMAKNLQNALQ